MAFKIKSFQKYITQTQAWLQKPTQACHHQIERIILTQKLIYHMKCNLAKHTELFFFFLRICFCWLKEREKNLTEFSGISG